MRICSVEGCGRKHKCRGLCDGHYKRMQDGRPLGGPIVPHVRQGDFCTADQCMRAPIARGLCWGHYQRDIGRSAATGPMGRNGIRKPSREGRDLALAEDVADLIEWRIDPAEAARRVGYERPSSLAKKLERLGHPELARPFWSAA